MKLFDYLENNTLHGDSIEFVETAEGYLKLLMAIRMKQHKAKFASATAWLMMRVKN